MRKLKLTALTCLVLALTTLAGSAARAQSPAAKEAARLEKHLAPWVTESTVGVIHVDTKKLKLRETYDEIYAEAKKKLPRTLTRPSELTDTLRMVEAVLDFTEAEIAKLQAAGGRDIFALVDMAFMTEVPVLFVVPVDVKKKTEVQAVMSFFKDAEWLPEDAKEELTHVVAVELVGDCVVFAPTIDSAFPGEKIIPADFLKKLKKNMEPAARPLLAEGLTLVADSAVKAIFLSNQPLEMMLAGIMNAMKSNMPADSPVPLPPTKTLVEGVQLAAVGLDLHTGFLGLHLLSKDEKAAAKLLALQKKYFEMANDAFGSAGDQPKAMEYLIPDLVDAYFEFLAPRQDGKHIYWTTKMLEESAADLPKINAATVSGVLVALLLPAVQQAREAARRLTGMVKMKDLILALNLYEGRYKRFPRPFTVDEDGQPLHSWRVLVLPDLEEEALYKQIRLDEPWDSEWNSQFHERMPMAYENPRIPTPPGMTVYAVVTGEETMFPLEGRGTRIAQCVDGTTNTVILVERAPVCWMDPLGDVPYEVAIKGFNVSKNGLATDGRGFTNFGLCCGTVESVTAPVDTEMLEMLFHKSDGKDVPYDWNMK